jgi:transcriptional regulator with XRE-family HTH domain
MHPSNTFALRIAAGHTAMQYLLDMESIKARLNALFGEAHEPKDAKVAEESGVSQPTIHRIRHGIIKEPSMRTIKKLADYFRVNAEWLASGIGAKRGVNATELPQGAVDLIRDFESLPDAFRIYLVGKARKLRKISDDLEPIVRRSLASPKDPDRYKEWEQGIDELLDKEEQE